MTSLGAGSVSVVVLGALAGCGGGQGGSCGDFSACGGDVVGSWSVQALCGKTADSTFTCPNVTYDFGGIVVSGTETFTDANVIMSDVQFSGFTTLHVPASCVTVNGTRLPCDKVGLTASMGLATADAIVCTTEAQGCSCKMMQRPVSTKTTATYTVTGTKLVITNPAAAETSELDYCVSGSTLRYKPSGAVVRGVGFEFEVNVVLSRD